MAPHYTYLQNLIPDPNVEKLALGLGVAAAIVGLGVLVKSKLSSPESVRSHVVPKRSISLFGLMDFFFDTWVKFQDGIIGKEGRKHAPFTATIFLFILLSNLLGLVPGFAAITTTVWINVGMALVVFAYFNIVGVKEQGLGGYLKHFAGPVWWLAPFIFLLEVMSTCLRVLTLNLRLYWNISADHVVLGVFTEIVPFGIPIPFYGLGTFVAFMQAFVFSLLTMVYIKFASHHEEHHGEEAHDGVESVSKPSH
jgi:F-type H+-transporting ATPase subunit a